MVGDGGGGERTMQIRKGVNHMIFYLYAIMEMPVRGKENFCLSPQLCTKPSLAGNKLPRGLGTAHGNHVKFQGKKEDFSVNRHPQRGCVDGQFAAVSWELDQTKHTWNLAGVAAWEGHAEIPSWGSAAHTRDLLYLCWSFPFSLLDVC